MNPYEQAAATWVERYFKYPEGSVSDVNFAIEHGGGCETCSYDEVALEFKRNGKFDKREIPRYLVTPGKFIEECVAILQEQS